MLTLEQTTKLQNRHLEIVINQKGYRLDPEIQAEMNYWRDILIREVAENQTLRSNLKRITDSRDLIREQLEGLRQAGQGLIDNKQREIEQLQNELNDNLDDFQWLGTKHQEATDKIQELEADLDSYDEISANKNQKITSLDVLLAKKKKTISLSNELSKQTQANQKKKKQLKRVSIRLMSAKQDNQLLQQEITDKDNLINQLQTKNNQQKATITRKNTFISRQQQKITDSRKDKGDLQIEIQGLKADKKSLQDENASKDQKIAQLEQIIQELRDKPPVSPVNNFDKSDNSPKQEPNNFLKEGLLKTIQQQKEIITELQTQLKNQSPQIVVKEMPVENLTAIQQLKKELKSKERNIKQLHLIYLLILGVSVLVLASLTLIKKARKTKKK